MTADSITTRVTITTILSERTYRATLPNGREIFVYAPRHDPLPAFQPGDRAEVAISPADFSRAQLLPCRQP